MGSSRSEGILQHHTNSARNFIGKANQNAYSSDEIQHCHSRHDFRSHISNGLQATDGNSCHNHGQSNTGVHNGDTGSNLGDFHDGIYLSKGTNAKVCAQHAKGCEHNCQGLIGFAQAIFDIVHRTAGDITICVHSTIFYSQQAFCIFSSHAKEGCNPHPKQSTGATSLHSGSNTNDVTGTNGSSEGSTQCLKGVNVTATIIFSTKNQL